MRMFHEYLPAQAAQFLHTIRWGADALGEVCSLDVKLEQQQVWLGRGRGEDRLVFSKDFNALRTKRTRARCRMLQVLNSLQYRRSVNNFGTMLRHGPLQRRPN
ncbi:MAG: hypothetical protein M2R45_04533 [Verrucomicrobia subdivision 3 bacterium]|nr:hypothetical protein [Limisphaerales bacterium]MCS1416828.1 hypothetical protein [Limisphaerales bacterium]